MAKTATLSSKSQITIPAWARKRLGLKTGSRIAVQVEDDRLVLTRVDTDIRRLKGSLKDVYGSADEYVRELRRGWR